MPASKKLRRRGDTDAAEADSRDEPSTRTRHTDKLNGIARGCVVKADEQSAAQRSYVVEPPELDQAALDAAAKWVFEPGRRT